MHTNRRWWALDITIFVISLLLLFEGRAPLSPAWHKVVLVTLVMIIFGLLVLWVRVNRSMLIEAELEEHSDEPLRSSLWKVDEL